MRYLVVLCLFMSTPVLAQEDFNAESRAYGQAQQQIDNSYYYQHQNDFIQQEDSASRYKSHDIETFTSHNKFH
jgi:hypothetical protein